jgi:uncharacterized SAM-binding protein YcdF (DUF218 family)
MLWALVAAVVILFASLYWTVRRGAHTQPREAADCIVVLGAGYERPTRQPTLTYRNRLRHGKDLYEQGLAKHIIVTELAPAGEIAREYLLSLGVPEDAVLYENRSRTTWQNLEFAQEVMREHGWTTAIIVSDGFHIHRSLMMCRDLGIPAQGAATPYSVIERVAYKRVRYSVREVPLLVAQAVRRGWPAREG